MKFILLGLFMALSVNVNAGMFKFSGWYIDKTGDKINTVDKVFLDSSRMTVVHTGNWKCEFSKADQVSTEFGGIPFYLEQVGVSCSHRFNTMKWGHAVTQCYTGRKPKKFGKSILTLKEGNDTLQMKLFCID